MGTVRLLSAPADAAEAERAERWLVEAGFEVERAAPGPALDEMLAASRARQPGVLLLSPDSPVATPPWTGWTECFPDWACAFIEVRSSELPAVIPLVGRDEESARRALVGGVCAVHGLADRAREELVAAFALDDEAHLGDDLRALAEVSRMAWQGETQRGLVRRALALDERAGVEPLRGVLALAEALFPHDLDGARAQLERARAILEKGPAHPRLGAVLRRLGDVCRLQDDAAAAEAHTRGALAADEAAFGDGDPRVVEALLALARRCDEAGALDAAVALLERALAIDERAFGAQHPRLDGTLLALSDLYHRQGVFDRARACRERGYAILAAALGPSGAVSRAARDLAAYLDELGDLPAARRLLVESIDVDRALYGDNSLFEADSLTRLGRTDERLGDLPGARAALERALSVREAGCCQGPDEIARTLSALAAVVAQSGERTAARTHLERALALTVEFAGADDPETEALRARLAQLDAGS